MIWRRGWDCSRPGTARSSTAAGRILTFTQRVYAVRAWRRPSRSAAPCRHRDARPSRVAPLRATAGILAGIPHGLDSHSCSMARSFSSHDISSIANALMPTAYRSTHLRSKRRGSASGLHGRNQPFSIKSACYAFTTTVGTTLRRTLHSRPPVSLANSLPLTQSLISAGGVLPCIGGLARSFMQCVVATRIPASTLNTLSAKITRFMLFSVLEHFG